MQSHTLVTSETDFNLQPELLQNSLRRPDFKFMVILLSQPFECQDYRYDRLRVHSHIFLTFSISFHLCAPPHVNTQSTFCIHGFKQLQINVVGSPGYIFELVEYLLGMHKVLGSIPSLVGRCTYVTLILRKWGYKDQKVKVILGYLVSSRPFWAT